MYQEEGKVLIVAPDDSCGVDTLKREKDSLEKLYLKGYMDGHLIREFMKQA